MAVTAATLEGQGAGCGKLRFTQTRVRSPQEKKVFATRLLSRQVLGDE